MEPERDSSRGATGLILLGFVWFLGTLVLGAVGFSYGFAFTGASAENAELAEVLIYTAFWLGGGAPVVGLAAAMHLHNKAGTWFYGLVVLSLVGLVLFAVYQHKSRSDYVWQEDPPVCTAPPERAHGVPGC
ncbi:hypothetical protein [Streptosporangium sp. NPDC048865]|uniref:hypothetical protein n=1 Tax=Streptosporangium sp. NPDC048865 TaxID=3155766 RepID=UPI0034197B39